MKQIMVFSRKKSKTSYNSINNRLKYVFKSEKYSEENLNTKVIIVGVFLMIFGAIEFVRSGIFLGEYEVHYSEGNSASTAVSISMEANHTYQIHIEIVASEHTKLNELNATAECYVDGKLVAE